MRILVTDAEVRKTLAVVRGLGASHDIITASATSPAIAAWSRFSRMHLKYSFDATFPAWLVDTIQRYEIEAVVCTQETTITLAGSRYKELEAAGARLTFPEPEIIERAFDKQKTLQMADSAGVPIPRTAFLEQLEDAIPAANDIGYPIIVKERFSHFLTNDGFIDSDGTQYATCPEDLRDILEHHHPDQPPPLLQEYVPGFGLAVFLLLDSTGEVRAEFAHRRIRDIRPTGSGSVLRESIDLDPRIRALALALLKKMSWWGVAMVEFRMDTRSGDILLMEVNGRFWGSLQLALDSGVNFPQLLLDVTFDRPSQPPVYRSGVRVRWWLGDLVRTIRVLKGPPKGYPGEFPTRTRTLLEFLGRQPAGTRGEVYRSYDPWPAVAELLSNMRAII